MSAALSEAHSIKGKRTPTVGIRRLSVVATRGEATNPKRKRGRARRIFLKKAVGVDPGPLTMRELGLMADAKARFEWGIASSVMALMANLQRDPKKGKPLKPSDFNPFVPEPPKIVLRGEEMKEALVSVFCGRRQQ